MNGRIFTILISLVLASCGGTSTFHEYARAGDTVAVPVGMQPDFSKDNITINITPSSGPDITLTATDPTIRAVINLYPDPLSNMLVSKGIGADTSNSAQTYANTLLISNNFEKDWYQTTVFLDLPTSLPIGTTQIEINNGLGATHSVTMEIIEGTGTANSFNSDFNGGLVLGPDILDSLARASHSTATIDSTTTIPHAIEATFTHNPDETVGGTGKAYVINPLGSLKNITWSDDGTNMKVIIIPSKDGLIDNMNDYKFYIAGTVTNLAASTVTGYDINGNEVLGITQTLMPSK